MTKYAPALYAALNGVFSVYKPQGMAYPQMLNVLRMKLAKDLNSCEIRPPRTIVQYSDEVADDNLPVITTVPDLADHPLVVGPRYLEEDFIFGGVHALDSFSSGVMLLAIGRGRRMLPIINRMQSLRVYHVKGQLGTATLDFTHTGKVMETSTYHHVTQAKIDKTISAIQAGHQKLMYLAAGVDIQSQEAYDLAVAGLIRPKDIKAGPVIYNLKCIEFNPPHFTLEVHAINEKGVYLRKLIHELGLHMKTTATCCQIRRIRCGHFDLSHTLLQKHWDAESIIRNIAVCRQVLSPQDLIHTHQMQYLEEGALALPEENT